MLGRVLVAAAVLLASACGLTSAPPSSGDSPVRVVAAENFWGSIAQQVGGEHAHVTSIIVNPDTDPHAYEATPGDARTVAQAQYVIVNGAGYDPWAAKLIDANPVSGRTVLTVGELFGKKEGDNPHMWYSPSYVDQVVDRIASDLARIDASDATYFSQQGSRYRAEGLKDYHDTISTIKSRYAGTKIGATESIVSYMAEGLGLDLITPYTYLKAISEGTDPSVADKAEVQREIDAREIKVFVFNSQNSTPDVQALVDRAHSKGIPVTTVTETLAPASATFQDWQTGQLKNLLAALGG
ncbi:MAG TPA: zinc ABC transporter substrate-binding protein [Candidatus Dormibacteraeota bacterium]|jgi:zinc/manganese transport system substrate-binding protein|nr:zinc ABC transporter substrate-binding protein [Candidatus Dormibacteraeota bacterium]